jgi:hypothetical protein
MAATFTATGFPGIIRETHEGVYAVTFGFDYSGRSASVSDVIFIGRLPAAVGGVGGVSILGGFSNGLAGTDGASTIKYGIPGADTYIGAAMVWSLSNTPLVGVFPKTPSVSADSLTPFVNIIATKVTGTSTVTGSFQLTLYLQKNPTSNLG